MHWQEIVHSVEEPVALDIETFIDSIQELPGQSVAPVMGIAGGPMAEGSLLQRFKALLGATENGFSPAAM